jgi:hypothetical protein
MEPQIKLVPIYSGRVLEITGHHTPREKAQRLKIEPTCSTPRYELPCRGVLAIFGLVLNDLLCQRIVDFRVVWEER